MSPRKPKYTELTAQVASLKRDKRCLTAELCRLFAMYGHQLTADVLAAFGAEEAVDSASAIYRDACLYGVGYSITREDGTVEHLAMDGTKKPV